MHIYRCSAENRNEYVRHVTKIPTNEYPMNWVFTDAINNFRAGAK